MNLLVINYHTDEHHGVLGWQPKVIRELARYCDKVLVLTSSVGKFDNPPENVKIVIIPARPMGIPQRFGGKWVYNLEVARLCRQHRIEAVFIHMAVKWAYILNLTFKALHLPIIVWYAHGTVTRNTKWMAACADVIVTSTPEGCRINSPKVRIIGQGVDTELFRIPRHRQSEDIVYFGRISPRKRIELLIDVVAKLRERGHLPQVRLRIVGSPISMDDLEYDRTLRGDIWDRGLQDAVSMEGFVPMEYSPDYYRTAFLHINVSQTNSMDKTVLEALSCGCPVLTSNPAFGDLLSGHPEFIIGDENPDAIAKQVECIYDNWNSYNPEDLRGLVVARHDLRTYAERVLEQIRPLVRK